MRRAVGWLPAAGGRASALRPLMPLPRRSGAGGSWGASSPTDARSWLLALPLPAPREGAEGSVRSPVSLPAGASASLKPSAPCLTPRQRKRHVLEILAPSRLPAVVFAAPSCGHS